MSTLIEQIKQEITLMDLLRENVDYLKATKPNGWYIGRCPFHQAGQPSKGDPISKRKFWVDVRPGRGICSCYVPRCAAQNPQHKPMDVINFYARLNGLSNRLAIFELADRFGLLEDEG